VALAGSKPGGVSICSTGQGGLNHLQLEMFKSLVKRKHPNAPFNVTHVPYNGVAPALTALRAGDVDACVLPYSGLIKNTATTSIKAFPVLGELPVLGALFRSTEFQSDKSELVFVITPRLVKPLPPTYALPTDNHVSPTRSQLMLGGKLEGRAPPEDASDDTSSAPETPDIGFQVK